MIAGVCSWLVIIPWGASPLFLQKGFSLIQTAVQGGNGRFRLLHLCLGGFNSHLHFLGVGSQARKCNILRAIPSLPLPPSKSKWHFCSCFYQSSCRALLSLPCNHYNVSISAVCGMLQIQPRRDCELQHSTDLIPVRKSRVPQVCSSRICP